MSSNQKLLDLQAERRVKPIDARARILEAFEKAGGFTVRAAVLLGISTRSLVRIVAEERLAGPINDIRSKRRKNDK